MKKSSHTHIDAHWITIALVSAVIFLIPCLFVYLYTKPQLKNNEIGLGTIRVQPGQLFILDETEAKKDMEIKDILACEELNKKICEIAFSDKETKSKLKTATTEQVKTLIENAFGEAGVGAVENAAKYNVRWETTAGEYGAFLLPNDNVPEKGKVFGTKLVNSGAEKEEYQTEKILNTTLKKLEEAGVIEKSTFSLRGDPITNLLERACSEGEINPKDAPALIASCQALNIKYYPSKDLYLSKNTLAKLEKWENILKKQIAK